ncbi:MAG: AAA family ATPase, partial [Deltaproteobacteria bacterium]|nr:AAA family ATPase [Deltaproteobacteria bacterium]
MSTFTFTVSNYRCFGETNPLTFKVGPGFSAFVGPNDAGKSTALRFFSEWRGLWQHIRSAPLIYERTRGAHGVDSPHHVVDVIDVFNDRTNGSIRIRIALDDAPPDAVNEVVVEVNRDFTATFDLYGGGVSIKVPGANAMHAPHAVGFIGRMFDYSPWGWLFDALAAPLYIPAFRNTINSGSANYYDLTLGTAFIASWDSWKNGANKRQRDAMIGVEEDIRKLLGYGSLAINASPDKKELRVVVDGRSRNLSDMGSGVSEFLLIIGNLFVHRPKTILIDEPETHLHPLKQMELLRLLLATSGAGVLLFATHSLGLARSV